MVSEQTPTETAQSGHSQTQDSLSCCSRLHLRDKSSRALANRHSTFCTLVCSLVLDNKKKKSVHEKLAAVKRIFLLRRRFLTGAKPVTRHLRVVRGHVGVSGTLARVYYRKDIQQFPLRCSECPRHGSPSAADKTLLDV